MGGRSGRGGPADRCVAGSLRSRIKLAQANSELPWLGGFYPRHAPIDRSTTSTQLEPLREHVNVDYEVKRLFIDYDVFRMYLIQLTYESYH